MLILFLEQAAGDLLGACGRPGARGHHLGDLWFRCCQNAWNYTDFSVVWYECFPTQVWVSEGDTNLKISAIRLSSQFRVVKNKFHQFWPQTLEKLLEHKHVKLHRFCKKNLLYYTSGSQTSCDRVPFVGPVFSPRITLKTSCSRKTPSTQYHSIKSLAKYTWRKCGMNNMAVRNYNGHFSKLREVHKNAGIY